MSYLGHGSVDLWGSSRLTGSDAAGLSNARPPVFFMFTCLNGYFQDPGLDSLAELLLKSEHGGAAAVYASSGFTGAPQENELNQALFRRLFDPESKPRPKMLGEAASGALSGASDSDVRRTCLLFGDPAMRLP